MKNFKDFLNEAILIPKEKEIKEYIKIFQTVRQQVQNKDLKKFRSERTVCDYINNVLQSSRKTSKLILSAEDISYSETDVITMPFLHADYMDNEITLYVAKEFHKIFNDPSKNFHKVLDDLYTNLEHELIHFLQAKAVKKSGNDPDDATYGDGDYLEKKDEVMAFARNASTELKKLLGKKQAIQMLKNPKLFIDNLPPDSRFLEYYNNFKNDSKTFKRFMKYVSQYLEV